MPTSTCIAHMLTACRVMSRHCSSGISSRPGCAHAQHTNVILQARRVQAETVCTRLCPDYPLRQRIWRKGTRPASTWCATRVQYLRRGGQTDARVSSSARRVQSTLQRPPCRSTPVSAALRSWTYHAERLQVGKDSLNLRQLSSGHTCSAVPKLSALRTEPGPVYFTP